MENGIKVTGIEISESAIKMARNDYDLNIPIHKGSVMQMPFDDKIFDGIYCYALIHLLSKPQRQKFISACSAQLKKGGIMVFTMISDKTSVFGEGKYLSKNRYQVPNGLAVYFYNMESAKYEFQQFELIQVSEINEPVKFMKNEPPLKMILVVCRKK